MKTLRVALVILVAATSALVADSGGCPPAWSYAAQADWGPSCTTALYNDTAQSPVSLSPHTRTTIGALTFNYASFPLSILNTATTFQVPADTTTNTNCTLTDSLKTSYTLKQFHFHFPAEHLVYQTPAERSAGEIHFVHQNAAGDNAVVAVRIALDPLDRDNPALKPIVDLANGVASCHPKTSTQTINPISFIPTSRSYIKYFGGLTTPPCNNVGVSWFVMASAITASKAQVAALKFLAGGNARDLQTLPPNWTVQVYNATQPGAKTGSKAGGKAKSR